MTKKKIGTFTHHGITVIYDGYTENGKSKPIVVCPDCGKERRVTSSLVNQIARGEVSGRCRSCACSGVKKCPSLRKKLGTFEHNGITVVYDGYAEIGRSHPLVTCPDCGKSRRVHPSYAIALKNGKATGRCAKCKTPPQWAGPTEGSTNMPAMNACQAAALSTGMTEIPMPTLLLA